ncbi:Uncharacterized protein Rs2_37154 [Raphanus sativus]|nr:Uncharacterized protein Rs2_37154 [Raphanus sativus]
MEKQSLAEKMQSQSYQRSRSENLEGLEKSPCGRLRRSETDASSERFDSDDELRSLREELKNLNREIEEAERLRLKRRNQRKRLIRSNTGRRRRHAWRNHWRRVERAS